MNDMQIHRKFVPLFPQQEMSSYSSSSKNIDFREFIKDAIYRTDKRQHDADKEIDKLMKGEEDAGIHETMLALSKADISMRLLMQIRNKTLESYKQIMQMSF